MVISAKGADSPSKPDKVVLSAIQNVSGFYTKITTALARSLLDQETRRLLDDVDLLAGPTEPVTAPELLAPRVLAGEQEIGVVGALTQYTRPYNINGFPAISIPCGFSDTGLPIGLQLAGRPFDELTVLRASYAYEQATDWHTRRPPL